MRKIRAEMPSNPQQNDLGRESNGSIAWDVATLTGAGFDRMVIRAVSFFGPGWTETPAKFLDAAGASAGESKFAVVPASDETGGTPAGFGRGCVIGEAVTFGGNTGGRRDEMTGVPALTGDGWMTDGEIDVAEWLVFAMAERCALNPALRPRFGGRALSRAPGGARCEQFPSSVQP